jgi:hypothetical protein
MRLGSFKIVSGGQTGADRAGLDFAIEHGIEHGGWCPKGRLAEDGPLDERYKLQETPTAVYAERTELNVLGSDGTVIFSTRVELAGGSLETARFAQKYGKPILHLARDGGQGSPSMRLRRFIKDNRIRVLNVAGPRVSQEPEVGAFVRQVLTLALLGVKESNR